MSPGFKCPVDAAIFRLYRLEAFEAAFSFHLLSLISREISLIIALENTYRRNLRRRTSSPRRLLSSIWAFTEYRRKPPFTAMMNTYISFIYACFARYYAFDDDAAIFSRTLPPNVVPKVNAKLFASSFIYMHLFRDFYDDILPIMRFSDDDGPGRADDTIANT